MIQTKLFPTLLVCSILTLTGCATGDQYRPNTYRAGQVNMQQSAKTVQILAIMPAKVEVDNTQGKKAAQVGGAILGALVGAFVGNKINGTQTVTGAAVGGVTGVAAGSLASDKILVDGVSLTYQDEYKTLNSAQVGRTCEYKLGLAVVIGTGPYETRIQPNNEIPCPKE
jgi:outer membrane lipoprotein SlyB